MSSTSTGGPSALLLPLLLARRHVSHWPRRLEQWGLLSWTPQSVCVGPPPRHRIHPPLHWSSSMASAHRPKITKMPTDTKIKRPICNEELVVKILSKYSSATADTAQVRVVLDSSISLSSSDGNKTAPVQVTSLSTAMALASQYDVDLVAINLDQDPVVIKAVDLQKLLYKEAKREVSTATHKAVKEFQFRTGIEDHDMQRKVDNLIAYLRKGHACQVMIQHYVRHKRQASPPSEEETQERMDQNTRVMETTIQKLRQCIGTAGTQQGQAKMNEEKTRCTLYFQPSSKQK
jgi:translation initiation factor IF-3